MTSYIHRRFSIFSEKSILQLQHVIVVVIIIIAVYRLFNSMTQNGIQSGGVIVGVGAQIFVRVSQGTGGLGVWHMLNIKLPKSIEQKMPKN